jgi:hypothetical protein
MTGSTYEKRISRGGGGVVCGRPGASASAHRAAELVQPRGVVCQRRPGASGSAFAAGDCRDWSNKLGRRSGSAFAAGACTPGFRFKGSYWSRIGAGTACAGKPGSLVRPPRRRQPWPELRSRLQANVRSARSNLGQCRIFALVDQVADRFLRFGCSAANRCPHLLQYTLHVCGELRNVTVDVLRLFRLCHIVTYRCHFLGSFPTNFTAR